MLWKGQPSVTGVLLSAVRSSPTATFNILFFVSLTLWQVFLGFRGRGLLVAGTGGLAAVLALVILGLIATITFAYAWATERAGSTSYAVTNQRILAVSSDGTSWIGLRELNRMRIRAFGTIDFERSLLPVEKILLQGPELEVRERDHTPDAIRNKLIFAGLRDPRSICDLVQHAVHHLPHRERR